MTFFNKNKNKAIKETPEVKISFIDEIISILEENALSPDVYSKNLVKWNKHVNPFSTWKERKLADNDYLAAEKSIGKIHNVATKIKSDTIAPSSYDNSHEHKFDILPYLKPAEIALNQKRLQLISVSAKNRAEYLSDKADFYPIFSALLGTFFTLLAFLLAYDGFKPLAYIASLFFIITAVSIRLKTRRQVAELKMMANILDIADKQYPKIADEDKLAK